MEGIMTGIKPRKMFFKGTLSPVDQEIVSDVERKMKLINAVGGGSPLSNPLTQFLLTAGPDLVEEKQQAELNYKKYLVVLNQV